MTRPVTCAELAVFLGITAAGCRSLIRNHNIQPIGKQGRANLYNPRTVFDALGPHDRQVLRKRRPPMAH